MRVANDTDRNNFITRALAVDLSKPREMSVKLWQAPKKDRSAAQNSLLYAWYHQIAKYTHEGYLYTRGRYKWEGGVPILAIRGEAEFDLLIDAIVNCMQYEQIIDLFGTDKIAISSVMKKGEFTDYLRFIEEDCATRQIPLMRGDEYDLALGLKA